jgi:hypothetical protein
VPGVELDEHAAREPIIAAEIAAMLKVLLLTIPARSDESAVFAI